MSPIASRLLPALWQPKMRAELRQAGRGADMLMGMRLAGADDAHAKSCCGAAHTKAARRRRPDSNRAISR